MKRMYGDFEMDEDYGSPTREPGGNHRRRRNTKQHDLPDGGPSLRDENHHHHHDHHQKRSDPRVVEGGESFFRKVRNTRQSFNNKKSNDSGRYLCLLLLFVTHDYTNPQINNCGSQKHRYTIFITHVSLYSGSMPASRKLKLLPHIGRATALERFALSSTLNTSSKPSTRKYAREYLIYLFRDNVKCELNCFPFFRFNLANIFLRFNSPTIIFY